MPDGQPLEHTSTGTNGSSLDTFGSYVEFIFFKINKMNSEHPTSAASVFGDTWLDFGSEAYRCLRCLVMPIRYLNVYPLLNS